MAITWDIGETPQYKKHGQHCQKTYDIIDLSVSVRLGGITQDNLAEWIRRATLYQHLLYPENYGNWTTREDIENHMGMTVNTNYGESPTKWNKLVMDHFYRINGIKQGAKA